MHKTHAQKMPFSAAQNGGIMQVEILRPKTGRYTGFIFFNRT
jgi:hypothetical protein